MVSQTIYQTRLVGALNRCLASGINIGDKHLVSVIETGAEFSKQVRQAAVAVRLDDGDQLILSAEHPSCLQRCLDLDRVMSVIVNYGDTLANAFLIKPTSHATEFCQGLDDALWGNIHFQRYGDCREAVLCIVVAEHWQMDVVHPFQTVTNPV